jgi:hypothetical protein
MTATRIKHIFIFILNIILADFFSTIIIYSLNFIFISLWDIDVIKSHKPMFINVIFTILFIGLLYPGYKVTNRLLLFMLSLRKASCK